MSKIIFLTLIFSFSLFAKDYFTIELLKTSSNEKAIEHTQKFKNLGFDAFTQVRPDGKSELYLSCINKFHTPQEATVFARNLKSLNLFESYKISLVLSKAEWISRFKNKKSRLPAKTTSLNLNPKNLPTRAPAAVEDYKANSFEGTPKGAPIENPSIEGQKFISTDVGLFVSIPTSSGDFWEKVNATFNTKDAVLHFCKDGTLLVNSYKLPLKQNKFEPLINHEKYNLNGYKVTKIYEKDGLLWLYFEKESNNLREPASIEREKRIFITSDYGKDWNELPGIIRKNY